ncbi:hypothetical protein ACFCZ3_19595 [Cellulosimicrobium cellulans]|uniref:hypothetical protein n=1 Tax=Cellulosimicrobium cellulans TaxID=1710 RepID=UPI0035DF74BE
MEELLAQIVEEISVLVADKKRKEPREIPRPGVQQVRTPQQIIAGIEAATAGGHVRQNGVHAMIAAAAKGRVRYSPPTGAAPQQ